MIRIIESLIESKKKSNIDEFFIKHEIIPTNNVGFSKKEQTWYGFSHRAIYGFKIGDTCKEGDLGVGDGYTFKPGDTLKTLDDCKQRAEDFAKSVD